MPPKVSRPKLDVDSSTSSSSEERDAKSHGNDRMQGPFLSSVAAPTLSSIASTTATQSQFLREAAAKQRAETKVKKDKELEAKMIEKVQAYNIALGSSSKKAVGLVVTRKRAGVGFQFSSSSSDSDQTVEPTQRDRSREPSRRSGGSMGLLSKATDIEPVGVSSPEEALFSSDPANEESFIQGSSASSTISPSTQDSEAVIPKTPSLSQQLISTQQQHRQQPLDPFSQTQVIQSESRNDTPLPSPAPATRVKSAINSLPSRQKTTLSDDEELLLSDAATTESHLRYRKAGKKTTKQAEEITPLLPYSGLPNPTPLLFKNTVGPSEATPAATMPTVSSKDPAQSFPFKIVEVDSEDSSLKGKLSQASDTTLPKKEKLSRSQKRQREAAGSQLDNSSSRSLLMQEALSGSTLSSADIHPTAHTISSTASRSAVIPSRDPLNYIYSQQHLVSLDQTMAPDSFVSQRAVPVSTQKSMVFNTSGSSLLSSQPSAHMAFESMLAMADNSQRSPAISSERASSVLRPPSPTRPSQPETSQPLSVSTSQVLCVTERKSSRTKYNKRVPAPSTVVALTHEQFEVPPSVIPRPIVHLRDPYQQVVNYNPFVNMSQGPSVSHNPLYDSENSKSAPLGFLKLKEDDEAEGSEDEEVHNTIASLLFRKPPTENSPAVFEMASQVYESHAPVMPINFLPVFRQLPFPENFNFSWHVKPTRNKRAAPSTNLPSQEAPAVPSEKEPFDPRVMELVQSLKKNGRLAGSGMDGIAAEIEEADQVKRKAALELLSAAAITFLKEEPMEGSRNRHQKIDFSDLPHRYAHPETEYAAFDGAATNPFGGLLAKHIANSRMDSGSNFNFVGPESRARMISATLSGAQKGRTSLLTEATTAPVVQEPTVGNLLVSPHVATDQLQRSPWDGHTLPYVPATPVILFHVMPERGEKEGRGDCRDALHPSCINTSARRVICPDPTGAYRYLIPGVHYYEQRLDAVKLKEFGYGDDARAMVGRALTERDQQARLCVSSTAIYVDTSVYNALHDRHLAVNRMAAATATALRRTRGDYGAVNFGGDDPDLIKLDDSVDEGSDDEVPTNASKAERHKALRRKVRVAEINNAKTVLRQHLLTEVLFPRYKREREMADENAKRETIINSMLSAEGLDPGSPEYVLATAKKGRGRPTRAVAEAMAALRGSGRSVSVATDDDPLEATLRPSTVMAHAASPANPANPPKQNRKYHFDNSAGFSSRVVINQEGCAVKDASTQVQWQDLPVPPYNHILRYEPQTAGPRAGHMTPGRPPVGLQRR